MGFLPLRDGDAKEHHPDEGKPGDLFRPTDGNLQHVPGDDLEEDNRHGQVENDDGCGIAQDDRKLSEDPSAR
jgi:hypothetical protein